MLEVVVVLGIMVIVVGMMLANFPRFRENLSIEREGSKLVLALRKAQSYALGVREFSAPGITLNDDPFCTTPPVKFPGYGVFIDTSLDKEYIIFGDVNCSRWFETFPVNEEITKTKTELQINIGNITAYGPSCLTGCAVDMLGVLYLRPGPIIFISDGLSDYDYAEISLRSKGGIIKTVVVRSSGQVSIQ